MTTGIYELVDGSLAQKLRFDTIANNLANVNTNGFKMDIIAFDEADIMSPTAHTDFRNGSIVHTGNNFDLALDGQGFFKVQTAQGIRYTRDGALSLNAEGNLVTRSGDIVLGQNGPINIEAGSFSVSADGQVFSAGGNVGQLELLNFQKPENLVKEGVSKYRFDGNDEDIVAADNISVKQAYIETSNVNPTEEMVKMMETFRTFETVQKAIQSVDEITSKMVNDPGLLQ